MPNTQKDYAANSGRISGGVGWSIQFNTPDCQHGWSVVKEGTGQSIGCYFKKEDAEEALRALAVTEPIVNKCMTCGCDDLGNDHHYISDTEKCMSCMSKGQGPCWDGYEYAGTKEQDGKTVPNCIPKKVKKDDASGQVNQNKQDGIGSLNFWNGSFAPVIGAQATDGWKSTYNSPPQHDGKQTVGYGNHSDPKGRSNQ